MKQREILFIVISIFVLVLAYIGFNIYHNATISTISPALSIQIAPIAPSFDIGMINSIKERERVSPDLGSKAITASSAASAIESFGQALQATKSGQQASSSSKLNP